MHVCINSISFWISLRTVTLLSCVVGHHVERSNLTIMHGYSSKRSLSEQPQP